MPFTTNDGVRLHWGEEGSGTPVLLIMGHLFEASMWYPVLPALAAEHHVVWFDNRGSGQSGATERPTIEDLVADARAVMDAAGLERAHVFGVSMGGGIALQLAYESPERTHGLVLGCTALKSESLRAEQGADEPNGTLRYRLPFWLLRPILRRSMYGPACPPEAARRDLQVMSKIRYDPKGILGQDRAVRTYDMTPDKVATVQAPTLVQHGTADKAVGVHHAHELMDALPNARLAVYEGAGHNYLVDCNAAATADLLAFLREVDAT